MRKPKNKLKALLLPLTLLLWSNVFAQKDSIPTTEAVKFHYYNNDNNYQWVMVESLFKKGKKYTPNPNKTFGVYLDTIKADNLIAKLTTGKDGKGKAGIPVSLKDAWDAND